MPRPAATSRCRWALIRSSWCAPRRDPCALHNTCRHRGSRSARRPRPGAAARLPLPPWTYDLDGACSRAPHGWRISIGRDIGLKPVHCETAAGYIFVCLRQDAPDFEPFRAQLGPLSAPHRLADARLAYESTIVEDGNWKLVWENDRECYHCAANHPELLPSFPERPTLSGISDALANIREMTAHWERCRGGQ